MDIGQLNRAILQRYDTYVEGSVLEWASFYFDELGPETLSEMWWGAEAAMFRMVENGELLSFNGIKSIEEVAIALGTRAVARQRRQGRYPEIDHTEQELLDFLVEKGPQQLSLF